MESFKKLNLKLGDLKFLASDGQKLEIYHES